MSDETKAKLSAAQLARYAASGGMPAETRRKIAAANVARGARWHRELAALLADLGELTDDEAGRLLGRDRKTVRVVRDEFDLPGPRSRRNGAAS